MDKKKELIEKAIKQLKEELKDTEKQLKNKKIQSYRITLRFYKSRKIYIQEQLEQLEQQGEIT